MTTLNIARRCFKHPSYLIPTVCFFAVFGCAPNHSSLEAQFSNIAKDVQGNIGISTLHIESGQSVSYHGDKRFPMQSVYKFRIAMVMLNQIDKGKYSLDDSIWVSKSEYIPTAGHSPLRDQHPDGAYLSIEQILDYNTSKSDGTACDVLLRLLGGTEGAQRHIMNWGVDSMEIATTEMVQVAFDTIQYRNWSTPNAMSELFKLFHEETYLTQESTSLLRKLLSISNPWFDRRIKGLLPKSIQVVHKTGSSRTYEGLTRATNDAGIVTLPDGSHVIISVFISDSYNSQDEREQAIARAAKAAYDHWNK